MHLSQILVTVLFVISGVAGQDRQTIRAVQQLIGSLGEDDKTFGRELLQVLQSRDILSDLEEIKSNDACSDKLFSLFSKLDTESYGCKFKSFDMLIPSALQLTPFHHSSRCSWEAGIWHNGW